MGHCGCLVWKHVTGEMCYGLDKGWLFIRKGQNMQPKAEENVGSTQFTVAKNTGRLQTAVWTKT